MKDSRLSTGFTIIEVVLFLAITGLMVVGLLVGVSGSIDRERYNDAVTSLHDNLQGQYNLVDNIYTNRPAEYRCGTGGVSAAPPHQPRGTSNCSIVGRYITSSSDGKILTSKPIYARNDITSIGSGIEDEQDLLDELRLIVAPDSINYDIQTFRIPWDTWVFTDPDNPAGSRSFTLALIRIPTNNLIRTYATEGNVSLSALIANAQAEPLAVCVERDGLVSYPTSGVKILRSAVNANGAQRITSDSGECA